ncbi:MAG: hypothetical protein ACD_71C00195G0003 [uncultured bacterium (gcode 4)]|uniref:Uncharacterized protein n=1 Tax=uncultured bacterium (gcode 4) TaxID=1234023 RepID=K2A2N0_9BACT|nr:MAG: hypothetical protein ACD_71C00195G0003 [uncultured bacterium (gcode 4)]
MANPNIDTRWVDSLIQDHDITVKLSDMVQTFNSLVQNKKLTEEEKNEFLKQWLWTDHLKIDEGSNSWLIDKMIQEILRKEGKSKKNERDRVKTDIEARLDGLRGSLSIIDNKEALTSITKGLREKYWKKPIPSPVQPTPVSEAKPNPEISTPPAPAPAHQETKPNSPIAPPEPAKSAPAPAPAQVTPAKSAPAPVPPSAPTTPLVQSTTGKLEISSTKVKIKWVKESLQWHFADVNNPTKTEIIKVLNSFKDKTFDKKMETPESSAAAIFSIQAWLRLQWIDVIIDWVYWTNTSTAIKQFQKKYNETATKKLIVDWIPWTNTIKALLDQLK